MTVAPEGVSSARRWARALALRALVLALGLDLAGAALIAPAAYLGLLPRDPLLDVALLLPLGTLALGIARWSPRLLLLGYPAALLLPIALRPAVCGPAAYGPVAVVAAATAFAAYLLAAARLTRDADARPAPDAQIETRPLATPAPPRMREARRRARLYRGLVAATAAVPLLLGGLLTLDPTVDAALRTSFPGQAQETRAIFLLGVLLLGLGLGANHAIGPLEAHASGDADLALDALVPPAARRTAGRRVALYMAALAALAILLLVVASRRTP